MEEVISSDKIYVINDGKIAMSGTPEQIFEREDELVRCNLEIPQWEFGNGKQFLSE